MRNKFHQEESKRVQVGPIMRPNKQILNCKLLNGGNSEDSPVCISSSKK